MTFVIFATLPTTKSSLPTIQHQYFNSGTTRVNRLTRVFPDKFHRAVKRLCVCVCFNSGCCHPKASQQIPLLANGFWAEPEHARA